MNLIALLLLNITSSKTANINEHIFTDQQRQPQLGLDL
jgi:hypothetical protein